MEMTKESITKCEELLTKAHSSVCTIESNAFYGSRQARLLRQALTMLSQHLESGSDAKEDAIALCAAVDDVITAFNKIKEEVGAGSHAIEGVRNLTVGNKETDNLH